MQTTMATLGAVAVLAAIVGGGFSAAGTNVPVIPSLRRQVLLALRTNPSVRGRTPGTAAGARVPGSG